METMDKKAKNIFAIRNWIPNIAFASTLVFYLFKLKPLIQSKDLENNLAVAGITSQHYTTLFIMLAISAVCAAIALIYNIIHLTRLKDMHSGTKIIWVVVLAALIPISLLLFHYTVINREPKYVDTYPDIA